MSTSDHSAAALHAHLFYNISPRNFAQHKISDFNAPPKTRSDVTDALRTVREKQIQRKVGFGPNWASLLPFGRYFHFIWTCFGQVAISLGVCEILNSKKRKFKLLKVIALLKLFTPAQVVQLIYLLYHFAFIPYLGTLRHIQ